VERKGKRKKERYTPSISLQMHAETMQKEGRGARRKKRKEGGKKEWGASQPHPFPFSLAGNLDPLNPPRKGGEKNPERKKKKKGEGGKKKDLTWRIIQEDYLPSETWGSCGWEKKTGKKKKKGGGGSTPGELGQAFPPRPGRGKRGEEKKRTTASGSVSGAPTLTSDRRKGKGRGRKGGDHGPPD